MSDTEVKWLVFTTRTITYGAKPYNNLYLHYFSLHSTHAKYGVGYKAKLIGFVH